MPFRPPEWLAACINGIFPRQQPGGRAPGDASSPHYGVSLNLPKKLVLVQRRVTVRPRRPRVCGCTQADSLHTQEAEETYR